MEGKSGHCQTKDYRRQTVLVPCHPNAEASTGEYDEPW